jgi:hypothetical protein
MTTETLDMLTETLYTELRRNYLNKEISLFLIGYDDEDGFYGILRDVRKEFIILETRRSTREIVTLSHIQSFCMRDKQ